MNFLNFLYCLMAAMVITSVSYFYMQPRDEYKYGDRIRIIKGFYQGCVAYVLGQEGGDYSVHFGECPENQFGHYPGGYNKQLIHRSEIEPYPAPIVKNRGGAL